MKQKTCAPSHNSICRWKFTSQCSWIVQSCTASKAKETEFISIASCFSICITKYILLLLVLLFSSISLFCVLRGKSTAFNGWICDLWTLFSMHCSSVTNESLNQTLELHSQYISNECRIIGCYNRLVFAFWYFDVEYMQQKEKHTTLTKLVHWFLLCHRVCCDGEWNLQKTSPPTLNCTLNFPRLNNANPMFCLIFKNFQFQSLFEIWR